MRISISQFIILLIFTTFSYAHKVEGQEVLKKEVSLNLVNYKLLTFLNQIERITNVKFLYANNLLKSDVRINQSFKNEKIGSIFDKVFLPNNIQYEASGNYIILKENINLLKSRYASVNSTFGDIVISGVITDELGNPLPGISILIKGTNKGTMTDLNGKYSLSISDSGNQTLVISGVGYKKIEKNVDVKSGSFNFKLAEDNLQLDQVVVTGSGTPKSKLESSVAVTSISSKQLDMHPPMNSMDLLKNIPGLSVESSGGDGPGAVRVRGLPAGSFAYMGVMEDGSALIPTGFISSPSADQFYKVDLTIKNVEAIRGGNAAMVLPSTAGALMNILSKTGGDKFGLQAKYTRGLSQNSNRFDINFGGPLAPKWKYNLGGFYRIDNGIKPANYVGNQGGQIKFNTTYEISPKSYLRFYAKYLNDRVAWLVPSYYSFDGTGQGKALPYFDPLHQTLATRDYKFTLPFNGQNYDMDLSQGFHTKLYSGAIEYKVTTANEWTIKNILKYQKTDYIFMTNIATAAVAYGTKNYYYMDGSVYSPTAEGQTYYTGEAFGYTKAANSQVIDNLEFTKQFGKNAISFGGSLMTYKATSFSLGASYITPIANNPGILRVGSPTANPFGTVSINSYVDGSQNTTSLYFNDEINYQKLSIDWGIRADNFAIKGNRLINTAPYNSYTTFDNSKLNWTYTVGLNYKIDEIQALFARGTKTYSSLTLNDLSNMSYNPATNANRNVLLAEAGYKLNTAKFSLFTSLVYAGLNNASSLMLIPSNTGTFLNMSAFASSRNISAEIEAVYNINANWKLRNVNTFQNSKYTDFTVTAPANAAADIAGKTYSWNGKYPERIPNMISELSAYYTKEKFNVFLTYRYIGKRWSSSSNVYQMNGYNQTSAGVDYKMNKNISFRLWGDNLLNSRGLTEGNIRGDQFLATGNFAQGSPQIGRIILPRSVWVAVMLNM